MDNNLNEEIEEKYKKNAKKNNKKVEIFCKTDFLSGDMFAILIFQKKLEGLLRRRKMAKRKLKENEGINHTTNILETNRSLLENE